jgi:hypothetical protein
VEERRLQRRDNHFLVGDAAMNGRSSTVAHAFSLIPKMRKLKEGAPSKVRLGETPDVSSALHRETVKP